MGKISFSKTKGHGRHEHHIAPVEAPAPIVIEKELIKYVDVIREVPTVVEKIVYINVPVETIKEVEKLVTITKEIIKEVPTTVEKIVEVEKEVVKEIQNFVDRIVVSNKIPTYVLVALAIETILLGILLCKFI